MTDPTDLAPAQVCSQGTCECFIGDEVVKTCPQGGRVTYCDHHYALRVTTRGEVFRKR